MLYLEYQMRARHKELLREAADYRLVSQAKQQLTRRRQLLDLALVWLGRSLRRWGDLLLERFGDTETDTPTQAVKSCI
ncbi:MAG: hypothetical protein WBB69_11185 [Anaerolineales bacterium]